MLVDPEFNAVVFGERGMMKGIDSCIQSQCLVSAITLIYSAIDAVSALTRPMNKKDTDRDIFMEWINKYLAPSKRFQCTPEDIYSARYGVLHNYGTASRLTRAGSARHIIYMWKDGPSPTPESRSNLPNDAIIIVVEHLVDALQNAMNAFAIDIEDDDDLKQRMRHHIKTLLCYKPCNPIPLENIA